MFGFLVVGLFFGVPAMLLYFDRSTAQVYLFSWVILMIALGIHSLVREVGDGALALISVLAGTVLSITFTSFVLFGYWMWEQIRRT